jgi:hypothetical protein
VRERKFRIAVGSAMSTAPESRVSALFMQDGSGPPRKRKLRTKRASRPGSSPNASCEVEIVPLGAGGVAGEPLVLRSPAGTSARVPAALDPGGRYDLITTRDTNYPLRFKTLRSMTRSYAAAPVDTSRVSEVGLIGITEPIII